MEAGKQGEGFLVFFPKYFAYKFQLLLPLLPRSPCRCPQAEPGPPSLPSPVSPLWPSLEHPGWRRPRPALPPPSEQPSLTGPHGAAAADRRISPAPVSPAAAPACPGRRVSSASVSPESVHMPGGGAALTGSPGARSSPVASSAPPRSPLPGPQPRLPGPLEGGTGEGSAWPRLHARVDEPTGSQI